MVVSALPRRSLSPAVQRAMTRPPRAMTSSMLEATFSKVSLLGDQHHNRHFLVDEGDGAVLHLAGRVAFGVDVGDLLQLQGALQGDGVVDAPAQVEEVRGIHVGAGDLFHPGVQLTSSSSIRVGRRSRAVHHFPALLRRRGCRPLGPGGW
jgi:hypothetical protein